MVYLSSREVLWFPFTLFLHDDFNTFYDDANTRGLCLEHLKTNTEIGIAFQGNRGVATTHGLKLQVIIFLQWK